MYCRIALFRRKSRCLPATGYRYVSRATPKDPNRHVILGTQSYKPRDFAAQMNLAMSNGWGIVRTVVDLCMKLPEGRYVLLKDPNKVSPPSHKPCGFAL